MCDHFSASMPLSIMAATGPNNSPQTTKDSTSAAAEVAKEPVAAAAAAATASNSQELMPQDTTATDMKQTSNAGAASTASSSTSTAAADARTAIPNYFSTKSSKAYTLAYKLLNSDNFQDALSTLETALRFTAGILRAENKNHKRGNSDENNDDIDFHESLAPLYYLYGSTLLYSVEESDVMMASSSSAPDTSGAPATEDDQDDDNAPPPDFLVDDNNDDDKEEQEQEGSEMMSKNHLEAEQEEPPSSSDPTEDLQIAWENLELARSIVSKLVESFYPLGEITGGGKSEYNPSITTYSTPNEQSELLLDLAQIHTRLGDLQRGNSSVANTSDCISDYTTALSLRIKVLGKYHKKVADSHYSLAGVYAEAPSKSGEEVEEAVERFVSELGGGDGGKGKNDGGGGGAKQIMTESKKMEYRERSLDHYVQCAVSFSGMLASMCGEDADALTGLNNETASTTASASTNGGGGIHSTMLSTLRSRISNLTPPTKSPEKESFEDVKEILDEIQEAVDTAEEAEEGLRTLGEMKANEIRKHEAKMNGEQGVEMEEKEGDGGGRTTIGFGASAAALAAAASGTVNDFDAASTTAVSNMSTSINAFGSTVASTGQPMMMVVKKKKKAQPVLLDTDSAKRAKTE